jgi:solute carrier family 25 protein 38
MWSDRFRLAHIYTEKFRIQSNMYTYESLSGALVSIVRLGPQELLRGFLASSLRDAPYAGLFVVFYEGIKREACKYHRFGFMPLAKRNFSAYLAPPTSASHSTVIHSVSAASAGAIATMLTQPFDVIKVSSSKPPHPIMVLRVGQTKIQVRQEDRYQGFLRTVHTIWSVRLSEIPAWGDNLISTVSQQRGISGYFDGASLRMSRKVLSSAIGWAVYEGILMFVRTADLRRQHL